MTSQNRVLGKAEGVNKEFYDELYSGHNAFGHFIRAILSFDQKSKAGPNLEALRQILGGRSRETRRLLDFGCGWGTLLLKLRRWGLELYCFDLSGPAMDSLAHVFRLLGGEVRRAVRSGGRLESDFFDVIVCSHVLEHVEDEAGLLGEFRTALRPGGHLLLNVPTNEVVSDPKHVRGYTEDSLALAVTKAGFEIVQRRRVDRWTAFLLTHESKGRRRRLFFRAVRGLVAVLPWRSIEAVGNSWFEGRYPRQQLIMTCKVPAKAS